MVQEQQIVRKKHMFTRRQLASLIAPLIVEQLLVMLVGMIDTVMVSGAGEAAISGVSIVNDVNNLIIQILAALSGGGAVIVSQYLGAQDEEHTHRSASQLLMICGLISTAICVFNLLLYKQILNLLYGSVEPAVMQAARTYFWITALSFPFLGTYNAGTALFRSMNETRVTMLVSILMNTINIVGNYIGVYVMDLGVAGVAWPTLISRIVAAVIMVSLSFRHQYPVAVKTSQIFSWDKNIIHEILTIAIPNSLENGLFQAGKIIISTMVATYGTSQIAANGVANSLSTLCYTTESAMSLAVVTVIGRCVGANDYDQARYYIRHMIGLGYMLALLNNIVVYLILPYALKLYTLTDATYHIAHTILSMECIAVCLLHTGAFVLPGCLRAAGDAKYTMYIGIFSMFIFRVIGAYLLGTVYGYGVIGTRIAMYLDWIVRLILFVIRYRSGKWTRYRIVGTSKQ